MGAFQSGFKMGADMYDQSERIRLAKEDQALRKAAEARAAEEHGWRAGDRRRQDEAWGQYRNTTLGVPANPSANDPDADPTLLSSPIAMPGIEAGPAGDQARARALEELSVGLRDTQGITSAAAQQRALRLSAIAAEAAKARREDIETQLPALNTNISGYPILYTGKGKDGYTFLTTDGKGNPGRSLTLSDAQVRRFFLAHRLGEAGFGVEAMNELVGVDKDLADHVQKWNTTVNQMTSTNNTATHNSNRDAADRAQVAASQARVGLARQALDMERMGRTTRQMIDKDGNVVEVYSVQTPKGIEWRQVDMPPGLKPYNPRGTDSGPAREVPPAGTIMQRGDRTFKADGLGGELGLRGVEPPKRAQVLTKAGIPKADAEQLQWTPDGQYVAHGGLAYDVHDPADLKELREALAREGRDEIMAAEVKARGFAPRYPVQETAAERARRMEKLNRPRSMLGVQQ